MVDPLSFIPKIEGFAPLPSAAADSFMAMQGGHMALYFGAYYKFATRFVDSQTNEDFNKMKADPKLLSAALRPHYDEITNQFHHHIKETSPHIQREVLTKAYELEILKIHQNVKLLKELPSAYWDAIFNASARLQSSEQNPVANPPDSSSGISNKFPNQPRPGAPPPSNQVPSLKKPSPKTPNPFTPIGINPKAPPPPKDRRGVNNAPKIKQLQDFIKSAHKTLNDWFAKLRIEVTKQQKLNKSRSAAADRLAQNRVVAAINAHISALQKAIQKAQLEISKLQ